MNTVLLVILILLLIGGIPAWGFHSYGWGPSGVLLVLLLVLLIAGR